LFVYFFHDIFENFVMEKFRRSATRSGLFWSNMGVFMAIEIIGTGRALPARKVTNQELAEKLDTSDEWIRSHTGIGARHIADPDMAASDLGLAAAKEALKLAVERGVVAEKTPEELAATLDLVSLGSSTGNHYCCPSTACLIQDQLGAKNAAALDISIACSTFIYGLETAAGLLNIDPRRKRALVIGVDILSRVTNWDDRSTCILFGDGSGAALLEKTEAPAATVQNGERGLIRSILGSDGSGWEAIVVPRGGSRNPWKKGEVVDSGGTLHMEGQGVYNFATAIMAETVTKLMTQENLSIDDIAMIVPHQANARIIQASRKRLKLPEEKVYMNIEEYANTSSASIPIALDELNRSGKIKKGDLILTVGFGAGLSYGGNLIRW
jgi:3-oxoacyl-[acyl-carrier-protein] synthase-3